MAPQTSEPSNLSTPTLAWSEEPSVELSQVPSQYPTRPPMVETSQKPSGTGSQVPSELSSALPSASLSPTGLKLVTINATADIFFPGIEEEMAASEVALFEKTTAVWLQDTSNGTWLEIMSVEVIGQAVVFSTIPSSGTRNLRRTQKAQGTTALSVTILVTAEATIEEGDDLPSSFTLAGVVEDASKLRDDLSEVVPLFIVEEPPFDARGDEDDDINDEEASSKNVGAIMGSVLVAMLFVLTMVAAVFYRRNRCTNMPLAEVQEFSCSSSSIGSASLFANNKSRPTNDPTTTTTTTTTDANVNVDGHLYPVQQLAPRGGSDNLLSNDTGSVGSGVSTSDFSEIYAMSSVGLSTDAGDGGIGIDPTTTATQDLGELVPPSSIAHHLYPIISISESGESTNNNGSDEVAAADGDKVSEAAIDLKDDDSYDCIMQAHQKKSIEVFLDQSDISNDEKSLDIGGDDSEEDEDGDDDDEEAGATTTKKGSPIKTMFSCFQPQPPLDGVQPSTLASSSIMSVELASSKSFASSERSMEKYEIRAPAGSLGMVVVTSREGPRVYHVKDESPLAKLIEEGDIIVNIDGQNTRHMTATALRRFLRSRDAQTERVITIRGRKRETEMDSSSGEYSL